ncbi:hypothetical protein HETIRDRAFT_55514 [Heterobasidion irregulare TC 32-1]|uniref:protein-tyrosine-phosphatase n=1 Tax=Heterobasidion irregulare (strain TC 32-1) TaxID=747525 RepID=W4JYF6_HETIT|nr:uncharacterized protein HETIRDRAFT_55514 [Heterobasidion irregulare TC 32-1]ETW78140.1 hypothetical protein HETIRDRAFT_55514 [Heterobasidion irregulare TC 32-1]
MDQVVLNLWVGDLHSAKDVETLKANGIFSVLSAMRGRLTIHETLTRHQVLIDDTEEADILQHLISSITFIQAELEKGRGVLVHCQAGMSRSATIVAAYLMYSQNIDVSAALELIKKARPTIQPNNGFLMQLEIFHKASFKVSRRDKATRMFYLERAVEDILNGDGSAPETDMFARFPRTPTDSAPATPGGPRRRIRCKMCRTELATRDHMLDHGQLGPPTPAFALSPAASRRPSATISRRPSSGSGTGVRPRLNSDNRPRRPSFRGFGDGALSGLSASFSMSALETEDSPDEEEDKGKEKGKDKDIDMPPSSKTPPPRSRGNSTNGTHPRRPSMSESAGMLGGFAAALSMSALSTEDDEDDDEHPSDLAAQLYANPKLAALRSPPLGMTPMQPPARDKTSISPPILMNPKCSGYFVEPMKWMDFFLENGELGGKIICPNKKCAAKIGNYDWAGVCCGCKEWVVPGFCIHRSKVDEIV